MTRVRAGTTASRGRTAEAEGDAAPTTESALARAIRALAVRTPTLPPATRTNSYALGARQVLLVEPSTPYDDEQRVWVDWARALEAEGRELVGILVTHHHVDHVGGARALSDALGVGLWGHAATRDRLPRLEFERLLEDGEVIDLGGPEPQEWQVLHTPGHAPGHLCLHEARLGALIVGDMLASEGTILIEPGDGDMRLYLEQLSRLKALGARVALPAHGGPIEEPALLFEKYLRHRGMREAVIIRAVRDAGARGATLEALVPICYADVGRALWPIAALSLEAHLIKLLTEGRVERTGERYATGEEAGR